MPLQIPADLTIVTLRANGRLQPQRFTEDHVRDIFRVASDLLRPRLDIEFTLGNLESIVEEMPGNTAADVVDLAGYHFLVAAHPAGSGVRAMFIDRLERRDLGGQAREEKRVCALAYGSDVQERSRMLAHEFAHLLGLPHIDEARRDGPGQEREMPIWARNLMNSGVLNPAAELSADQVRRARTSTLARRFGGS